MCAGKKQQDVRVVWLVILAHLSFPGWFRLFPFVSALVPIFVRLCSDAQGRNLETCCFSRTDRRKAHNRLHRYLCFLLGVVWESRKPSWTLQFLSKFCESLSLSLPLSLCPPLPLRLSRSTQVCYAARRGAVLGVLPGS